jgi:acyl-CoA synthetase (AMP-forming)/AMP-acid ligase II
VVFCLGWNVTDRSPWYTPGVQESDVEEVGRGPARLRRPPPGASATEADLRAFVREHLAHFKAPHAVTFLAELPKTATGKIQKFVLRGGRPDISVQ